MHLSTILSLPQSREMAWRRTCTCAQTQIRGVLQTKKLFLGGVLLTPFSHLGLCLAILVHGLTSPPSLSAGPTENAYWPARPASGVRLERNLGGAVNSLSFRTIPVSILNGYDSWSIKALSSHDGTLSHKDIYIDSLSILLSCSSFLYPSSPPFDKNRHFSQ